MLKSGESMENNNRTQQVAFDALCKELAEKELELATLENELAFFERIYAQRVGKLYVELDQLDAEIARELHRLHHDTEHQAIYEAAEQKAHANRQAVDEKLSGEAQKSPAPSEEVRNLFRKIAKIIHPDLATDEEDRAFRTRLMARANAAYKSNDKAALEQIFKEWEHRGEQPAPETSQLAFDDILERQINQIQARIRKIETRIEILKKSDLYQLMSRVELANKHGQDLLGEMAVNIQTQINAARDLLLRLRQQEQS
jgi:hypothetical protein